MINLKRGIDRLEVVLRFFGGVLLVAIFTWITVYGPPGWSNWPIVLGLISLYVVGVPLAIFLPGRWRVGCFVDSAPAERAGTVCAWPVLDVVSSWCSGSWAESVACIH